MTTNIGANALAGGDSLRADRVRRKIYFCFSLLFDKIYMEGDGGVCPGGMIGEGYS